MENGVRPCQLSCRAAGATLLLRVVVVPLGARVESRRLAGRVCSSCAVHARRAVGGMPPDSTLCSAGFAGCWADAVQFRLLWPPPGSCAVSLCYLCLCVRVYVRGAARSARCHIDMAIERYTNY